jgi:hypothetical protein
MTRKSMAIKSLAAILSFWTVIMTVPFSSAEVLAASPSDSVVMIKRVAEGNVVTPKGTTFFTGERVASDSLALLDLTGISRIEVTKAAVSFDRQGKTLAMQVEEGSLHFDFFKGDSIQMSAGNHISASANDSTPVGEVGLKSKGQVLGYAGENVFAALNTATGARSEAYQGHIAVMDPGKGAAASDAAAMKGFAAGKPAKLSYLAKVAIWTGAILGGAVLITYLEHRK